MRKILLIIMSFVFITSCDKNKIIVTGFNEIDNIYIFSEKKNIKLDKKDDYLETYKIKNNIDSTYIVFRLGDKINRGWMYKDVFIGDWYYESKTIEGIRTDSIINYINFCGRKNINTKKIFNENKMDVVKSYYYTISLDKNKYNQNEEVNIKIQFHYDKNIYTDIIKIYFFKENYINDFCNYKNQNRDSLLVKSNQFEFVSEFKTRGIHTIQGYFFTESKKGAGGDLHIIRPIFFEIPIQVD